MNRVGFIATNIRWKSGNVVGFHNKCGTAEQWIKEGEVYNVIWEIPDGVAPITRMSENIMKIGMLTHHWPPNFGANLQATSTFLLLKKLGHHPIFLNFRPPKMEKKYRSLVAEEQRQQHTDHHNQFYEQTAVLRSEEDLAAYCQDSDIDMVLAGSDTILRVREKKQTEDCCFPNPFWMLWTKKINPKPKTSMISASSEGTYYWFFSKKMKQMMSKALLDLDFIAVRDRWTQNMVRYLTHGRIAPPITPDPVAVLNNLLPNSPPEEAEPKALSKQYVLLHFSPRLYPASWIKEFVNLAHQQDLQVFTLPGPSRVIDLPVDRQLPLPMSPLEWYFWIRHSAGMICDAFHTVISCIYNDVPFLSINTSGPTWFKCVSIRKSSKAYDACMNVNMTGSSYLPLQARVLLSPKRALQKLRNVASGTYEPYASRATLRYEEYLRNMLGNF